MSELPFECNECGKRFGFGDGSAAIFLGVVTSVPFQNEPTPCCGTKISGNLLRNVDGSLELELA